jgi:hypothetical protein
MKPHARILAYLIFSRTIKIVFVSVVTVFAAAVLWFVWRAHADHRSAPGRIVRFFRGEGGMAQDLNDMSEDIRNSSGLAQLQPWALETLKRYREGKLQTNGYPQFYPVAPAVKLARQERPGFINRQWGETNEFGEEEPEIFIVLDANRQPEAVGIGWYQYGIQLGPPEYHLSYTSNYYCPYVQAKPGVYVYGNYK